MEAPVFTKKRPKQQHVPTRHLLVLFAGKADFVEDDGHVQLVVLDNSARLFVSFDCVEAAEAAVARLRGTVSKDESSIRKSAIECYFCTSSLDSDEESSIPSVSLTKFVDAPPEGLTLECEFVTAEEESELLAFLDAQEWDSEIKRRVQHFGYSFDYKTRSVNPSFASFRPIPPILTSLFERLVKAGMPGNPDQITVNEYVPGIGIKPHIDTHSPFSDGIASLSLGAPIAMELRSSLGTARCGVGLPERSLLLLRGEARFAWTHGIAARKSDVIDGKLVLRRRRVSVTFRQVTSAGAQCRCAWPACCDSQARVAETPPGELEKKGVEQFYNRIAEHFSQTRHTPWPRVAQFVKKISRGMSLLDVGCGNGRHLLPARDSGVALFGCDFIARFVEICVHDRNLEVLRCDAQHLPYRSNLFDNVMCIAVIHHFASEERRLRAVAELVRVTALKGRILITVWAFEQESGEKSKRQFDTQDVTVPWVLPAVSDPERKEEVSKITDEKSRKQLQPVSVDRFCHVFVKNELETLVSKLPNVQILESYFDNANWAVVLRKISL